MTTHNSALGKDAAAEQLVRIEPGILPENIKSTEDLQALNSALALLFSQLREARRQFECHGASDRLAPFTALGAFWKFIYRFRAPYEDRLMDPILRLLDALAMLDQGLVESIVAPVRRSGRAPSSHAHASLKGLAAATVQRLLQTGVSREEAHRRVAKRLTHLGVRAKRGSGAVTATTVRNWCDEVSSDVSRRNTAAMMYESTLAPAEQARFLALPKKDAERFAFLAFRLRPVNISGTPQKPS